MIALTRGRRAEGALRGLGATVVLDTSDPDLGAALLDHTAGEKIAVMVLRDGYAGNDARPLPVNVVELYNRRATLTGLTTGDRREFSAFWADMRREPVVLGEDLLHTFPLEQAAHAHAGIEHGNKIGHFVLSVS